MSKIRSVDIDEPSDLNLARSIANTDGKTW
jgi:CMP-N-acetylneuraminic acid synthetase